MRIKVEKLKQWFELAEVTQEDFARECGIDAGNFSKYVTGKLSPTSLLIQKIMNRTGLPFDSLFELEGGEV